MSKIRLGVSGERGSFSEQAGVLYAKKMMLNPSVVYLTDMEGVLSAIAENTIDFGILPVVNLRGGLVHMAFTAMGSHLFEFVDDLWLEVHQCLLACPGTKREEINRIVSHPQALAQCQNYLKRNFSHTELIDWQDTAKAARDLAEGNLSTTCAVIASEAVAQMYGLTVLARDIQDETPNLTAFIIVKPRGTT
jgi:prephenate dehydratase